VNGEPRSSTLPFCSQRCRAADLGSWLNESYRIAGASLDEEEDGQSSLASSDAAPRTTN
jgi:endogenous inhibitor of DNA gyrase (YacG/DUF329 family)